MLIFKKIIYWNVLLIILVQILLAMLPNVTYAQTPKATTLQIAQTWEVLSILDDRDHNGNGANCTFKGDIYNSDADKYEWFDGQGIDIGYVNNNPGGSKCSDVNSWFVPALKLWGLDSLKYTDLLIKLGYSDKAPVGEFTENDKNIYPYENLKKLIPSQFIQNGGPSDAVKYASWYAAFINGCDANIIDNPTPNDIANTETNKDQYFKIKTVVDKTVQEKIYKTTKGRKDIISVGWNIGANKGGVADCAEINDKLNTPGWAEAMAATGDAADLPHPGTTPTGDKQSGCSQALTPLGWILCPIANVADNILAWYENIIKSVLYISPDALKNGGDLYQIWRVFTNLGSALIVLVALVMIGGQIFNFEIFSAYTIKKVLPRLIIGAILMQLSWFLCKSLLELVNAIGTGIYYIILSPLKFDVTDTHNNFVEFTQVINYGSKSYDGGAVGIFANGLGLGVVAVAGAAALVSGAWMMVIVGAVGVLISLAVGIVTLMIRAMLIIILIALAPLAIAAWILPGTQNLWNMWWKMFSRLLMMFPLIMILFAGGVLAGCIMASTKFGGDGGNATSGIGVVANFAILIAYFAPVFMISMTYKFAGGAFSSIASMGDKLGKKASGSGLFGLRDRAKFAKENSSWALAKKAKEGERSRAAQSKYTERLGRDSWFGNSLRRRAASSPEGRARIQAAAAQQENEERMKEAAAFFDYQTGLGDLGAPEAAKEYLKIFKTKTGQKVTVDGKEVTVTKHMRKEALDRIAQTQQIPQMRDAATYMEASPTDSEASKMYTQTIGKHYAQLKEKAPDLTGIGGSLKDTAATDMMKWNKSTWENWAKTFDPTEARFAEQMADLTNPNRSFSLTGDASQAITQARNRRP